MIRRLLIPLVAAAAVAVPATAVAHTPAVADNCHNLTVTLTNYEGTTPNNRVSVTIDGAVQTFDYGASFARTFTWSPTAAHAWTVVVDANRVHGHPTEFDRTFNGTETPCIDDTTTTTSSTSTTTSAPTTTSTPTSTSTTTTTSPSSTSSTSSTPTTTTSPPVPTTSIPATTSPTAPAERLDNLPVTGSTTDPWWILPPVAVGLLLTLAARRPRTP